MHCELSKRKTVLAMRLLGSLMLALSAGGAMAQTYFFSPCGQAGATGPSQGQCDTTYTATTLAGNVTVTAGIQAWTVPQTGYYKIEGYGAQGGTHTYSTGFAGGLGAYASGSFPLTAGQTIHVLAGQKGGDTTLVEADVDEFENAAPGGGGASYAYLNATDALPLLAAGGGGSGARCTSATAAAQGGSAGTSGNRSGSLANGGTGGNGGRNNVAGAESYWAGGGAGWLTDGTGGENATNYDYTPGEQGAEGGRSPRNGGLGGIRWQDEFDEGGDGGFGGGGGGGSANMGGGGGAGFSGGGGAAGGDCSNEPGGGGGSYSGGLNAVTTAAVNTGDGAVRFTYLGLTPPVVAAAAPVPAVSTLVLVLIMLALGVAGTVSLRRS